MYNKVKINQIDKNHCIVQAISIKKNNENFLIPSPFGIETIQYGSIEEAIFAVKKAGYEYCISKAVDGNDDDNKFKLKLEQDQVLNAINYDKIIDVFIKNLGHENLDIRNSAIKSLSKFGLYVSERLVSLVKNDNSWLIKQSAIKCMENILIADKNAAEVFTNVLIEVSNSENTLVKGAALKALEQICDNRFE